MPRRRRNQGDERVAEALARTAPLVSRWIERLLAAHEPPLTVVQYLTLRAVDEGDVAGSDLARRAAVSAAAVSQLLVGLESAGLLERRRLEHDRRRQPLVLTVSGRATLRSAQRLVHARLAALLADMPERETHALADLLAKLEGSLGGSPPPRARRPPPPPRPGRPGRS